MRKLFLLGLGLLALGWVLWNYLGHVNPGRYESIVLDFRDNLSQTQIESTLQTIRQQEHLTPQLNSQFSQVEHLYWVKGDRRTLKSLRRSLSQVAEHIEPNYIYRATTAPNDPDYVKQWNFRSIHVEGAWEINKGSGVTVAVIDTGVSPVPDLKNTEFVPGYDFVHDRVDAADDNGHGTHVAGTIAQSTNNRYGVAGIAYEAKIMPLKVLAAEGGGTIADIAEAIRFAADQGAQVINLSLGGSGESQVLQDAITYAHGKGVVIIAAAGNESTDSASYPARYPHVIGVAALDAAGKKSPYSNYGAGVDIAAPGGSESGGILQNTIDPETGQGVFAELQGTSMAAPHVAGVAALIRAAGVEQPDDVRRILQESALKVGDDPLNHYGAGQLDAAAAIKLAIQGQISFRDFFRWLRDNGYLNPRFWFDGGAVALVPKLVMVIGSYLLAWLLQRLWPFQWSWLFSGGLIAGSSGIFFLRGLYILDLPQWPMRVLGSSIPELGGAIQGSSGLNPLFASVVIPLILVIFLLGHPQWRGFAIGCTIGVAASLAVSAITHLEVWWLGQGTLAQIFLIGNALLCFGLAYLALKPDVNTA